MHARTRETRRRHIAQTRALQEREPSLINLPIPLPVPIASIPVLGPILSPLIEGLPWPTPTSSTPVSATTAAVSPTTTQAVEPTTTTPAVATSTLVTTDSADASSPTSSSGDSSGSSGSSSGSSSVGGEGGDGSSSSSSTGGDVGTGADGGGEGASGGSGVGGSGGVGSASSAPSGSSDGTGGGVFGDSGGGMDGGGGSTGAAAGVSSGADPASDAGSHQFTAVRQGASATSTSPSPSSAQPSTDSDRQDASGSASAVAFGVSATSTAIPMAVENAFGGGSSGVVDTNGFAVTSSTGTSAAAATGTAVDGSSSRGSGSSGSGSSNSNGSSSSSGTSASTSTSHHGLTRGAIAAIVVVVALLVLATIAVLLRRRAVHKRVRRRKHWLFGGQTSVYGNSAISSSQYFTDHPNGRAPNMSERSSFGTGAPWETFHDPLAGSAAGSEPSSRIDISVPPVGRQMKGSMQSVWTTHLNGSMVFAPSLATVATSSALPTIRSPDRASWGSAKTDADGSSGEDAAWVSCPESVAVSTRSHGLPSSMSVRPFSPSDLWQFPKPPHDKRRSRASPRVVSPESVRESSEYATAPENPFGDHASAEAETEADALTTESADTETASHFARVETIRRPFVPALEDEMGVVPGERVRMLQRFPDGWAYAEKVGSRRRGVIPIDCLRTPEEDLPAFLASKRLSSYRPSSVHTKSEETGYSTVGVAM